MSPRRKTWSIGLASTLGASAGLALDESTRGLIGPSALLAVAATGLVAEVVARRSGRRDRPRPRPRPLRDDRPADGAVEILPMLGVEAVPNPASPRFRRFERLEPSPDLDSPVPAADPPLLGRVAWISVFVGMDGKSWTDEEIARAHQSLERAGGWIEREAIRLDAPVNIALAEVYFRVEDDRDDPIEITFKPEGDDVGPWDADASTRAIVGASRAAAGLGFADAADWIARVDRRVVADARAWIFHLRRAGRSFAIPARDSDLSGVALAACFAREASFPEPLEGPGRVDPTTVVHEVLHLFGASDKYGVPLRKFPEGSVTPRDVMRLEFDSLSRMAIGRLTASEVGWPSGPGASSPRSGKAARR